MSGPLPDPNARRRNKRKPGTPLPLDGPLGKAPKCPYALGKAGKKWWKWAWKLPQAVAWDDGAIYFVARRAQLEDEVEVLEFTDYSELRDLLVGAADEDAATQIEWALSTLKKAAGGKRAIDKEMREMDNRLGLNPKSMADLRWTLEAPEETEQPESPGRHLRAVDASAG